MVVLLTIWNRCGTCTDGGILSMLCVDSHVFIIVEEETLLGF